MAQVESFCSINLLKYLSMFWHFEVNKFKRTRWTFCLFAYYMYSVLTITENFRKFKKFSRWRAEPPDLFFHKFKVAVNPLDAEFSLREEV